MSNAIQSYGNVEDVILLQERIQSTYTSLFPNGAALTNDEAFALAQVGFMQGLDPFNKEIYYLKTVKDGVAKSLGVMPGIRGLRKHAHRQIRFEGGRMANFWIEFSRIIDKEGKDAAGAGEHDLVVRAQLRDSVTMTNYLQMRHMIFGDRSSWGDLLKLSRDDAGAVTTVTHAIEETARQILGEPPIVTTYGIIRLFELKKDGQNVVRPLQLYSGQNAYYMAEIRAERKALYKRFDLERQFGAIVEEAETVTEFVDADIEAAEEETPEETKGEPKSQAEIMRELGFGG